MALDLSGSQGAADQATSTGQNAINSFDPTSVANKQQSNLGAGGLGGLLGGQTNQYIGDYSKAVANNPTVSSLYDKANQDFGVQPLASTATNLQNEVTNAVPSGYAGAKGFDIGNTQVQNGIAQRLGFLLPQSNAATNAAQTAQTLAGQKVQAGIAQNAQNLLPVQAEAPLLQGSEAAQGQGWNQATQQEFQGLIDKMNAGVTLSATEMSRANQLAQMEESYQQAVTTANIGNQYKTVAPGNNLVNTFTNSAINPSMLTARTGSATF